VALERKFAGLIHLGSPEKEFDDRETREAPRVRRDSVLGARTRFSSDYALALGTRSSVSLLASSHRHVYDTQLRPSVPLLLSGQERRRVLQRV
jgi:hypothetical protein